MFNQWASSQRSTLSILKKGISAWMSDIKDGFQRDMAGLDGATVNLAAGGKLHVASIGAHVTSGLAIPLSVEHFDVCYVSSQCGTVGPGLFGGLDYGAGVSVGDYPVSGRSGSIGVSYVGGPVMYNADVAIDGGSVAKDLMGVGGWGKGVVAKACVTNTYCLNN